VQNKKPENEMDVMGFPSLFDSPFYGWAILPFLIFLARVLDVSMGTVRVIFVSRGFKYLAPLIGFVEVLVWLLAIGQIMKNLSNPICYIAYASGFAMGNFVGMLIAERLSLGVVLIRVITNKDAQPLVSAFQTADYRVTCVDGQGSFGPVKIVFTILPRRQTRQVVNIIKKMNPDAFYTIEDVDFVKKGGLPVNRAGHTPGWLRPFRKGK
jgi:uncharacterized protein YebE (UPF0316 family)